MSKQISPLLIIGGAAAAYLLLNSGSQTAPGGVSVNPITNALANLLPGSTTATQQIPTNYGINSGVRGADGVLQVSNYPQLIAANPNLGNPNYIMSASENGQYLANYLDLQQGLPAWIGHKAIDGSTPANLSQAAQVHWKSYGCAEKRIFLPMQPPSNVPFVPAPAVAKSSGTGILGTVLKAVTIVAGGVLTVVSAGTAAPLIAAGTSAALTVESAIHGISDTEVLNNTELQLLFQGAAILYDILPLYEKNDPLLVTAIKQQLDTLLKQYA